MTDISCSDFLESEISERLSQEEVKLSEGYFSGTYHEGLSPKEAAPIFPGSDIDYSTLSTVDARAILKMVPTTELKAIEASVTTPAIKAAVEAIAVANNPLADERFSRISGNEHTAASSDSMPDASLDTADMIVQVDGASPPTASVAA